MAEVDVANTDVQLAGHTLVLAEVDVTISGLHTFDRSGSAPLAIGPAAPNVPNLDADKIDGLQGTQLARLDVDNTLVGKQSAANQPSTLAYNNAVQSLTDSTDTPLIFNTEDEDVGSNHDNVTNNTRLTAIVAGLYLVSASASFAANATGVRKLWLRKNGATKVGGGTQFMGNASVQSSATVVTTVRLAVNDYIEVMARQTSGGALNAGDASNRELQNSVAFVKLW